MLILDSKNYNVSPKSLYGTNNWTIQIYWSYLYNFTFFSPYFCLLFSCFVIFANSDCYIYIYIVNQINFNVCFLQNDRPIRQYWSNMFSFNNDLFWHLTFDIWWFYDSFWVHYDHKTLCSKHKIVSQENNSFLKGYSETFSLL